MTYAMQRIGQYKESDQASALKERDHKDATDLVIRGGGYQMSDTKAVVRRLTPVECSRLQGYPDDWCEIGDWTDSNGKVHKDADSPKYKALGNSICLPFWQFMARRICAQYERPITIGSLFDGISGFPLVFSRAGAIPLWSSEIEPFCIAVSKKHFGEE